MLLAQIWTSLARSADCRSVGVMGPRVRCPGSQSTPLANRAHEMQPTKSSQRKRAGMRLVKRSAGSANVLTDKSCGRSWGILWKWLVGRGVLRSVWSQGFVGPILAFPSPSRK